MNVGSTACKESYGDKSSQYEAIFFPPNGSQLWNLIGSDSQSWTVLSPSGHLATSGDTFGCCSWGGPTGIYWVEARNAAKHPSKHITPLPQPQTETHVVQNIRSPEAETQG